MEFIFSITCVGEWNEQIRLGCKGSVLDGDACLLHAVGQRSTYRKWEGSLLEGTEFTFGIG